MPADWCQSVILPICKNEVDIDDPNSYRGISLLSCFGKLFTSCLNRRLTIFIEKKNIVQAEQAGCKSDFSTIDHVFFFKSLADMYLSKRQRLYCCFVDYKKAFDTNNRTTPWSKILSSGISGKILNVIKKHVYKSKIKCIINIIDEEIVTYFKLYILLYADDTVILAENPNDLQASLNEMEKYCDTFDLHINVNKTRILIFSRGKLRKHHIFNFGEHILDTVDEYNYLGLVFNYNAKFKIPFISERMQSYVFSSKESQKFISPTGYNVKTF